MIGTIGIDQSRLHGGYDTRLIVPPVASNAPADEPRRDNVATGIDVGSNAEGHCFIKGRAVGEFDLD
jgi:hypothetical protein